VFVTGRGDLSLHSTAGCKGFPFKCNRRDRISALKPDDNQSQNMFYISSFCPLGPYRRVPVPARLRPPYPRPPLIRREPSCF
jgi:hypothetical protein